MLLTETTIYLVHGGYFQVGPLIQQNNSVTLTINKKFHHIKANATRNSSSVQCHIKVF